MNYFMFDKVGVITYIRERAYKRITHTSKRTKTMADFFTAFNNHNRMVQPVIAWLDANAGEGWGLWHSGGGCTHYVREAEFMGMKGEFILDNDSCAEPTFEQDYPWTLCFMQRDEQGEDVCQFVLSQTYLDMRDAVAAQTVPEKLEI